MFTSAMIKEVAVGREDAGTTKGEGVGIDEIGGGGGVE